MSGRQAGVGDCTFIFPGVWSAKQAAFSVAQTALISGRWGRGSHAIIYSTIFFYFLNIKKIIELRESEKHRFVVSFIYELIY